MPTSILRSRARARTHDRARRSCSRLSATLLALLLLAALLAVVTPTPTAAAATTFTVTSPDDTPDADISDGVCADASAQCSLRAAVQQANASAGADTLVLDEQTYGLTTPGAGEHAAATGDLDLTDDVTIEGNDAVVLGNGHDRVFDVRPGVDATISRIVVAGGRVENEGGGGIFVGGHLDLDHSVVLWNDAVVNGGTAASAGGIMFGQDSTGGTISNSAIVANTAPKGGGLRTKKPVTLSYSTVAQNEATTTNEGSGIKTDSGGIATLDATIVADNTGGPNCLGTVDSTGHNLTTDATCGLDQPTDHPSTPAELGTSLAPLPTSPAIDAGGTACTGTDVEGRPRPLGAACEIGAYEYSPSMAVTSTADTTDVAPGDGVCADASAQCSLRAAVQEANALPGPDSVVLEEETYTLATPGNGEDQAVTGDLDLTDEITIDGRGAIVLGGTHDRVFDVRPGVDATISHVVVAGGVVTDEDGGAIRVGGHLDLDHANVFWNQAVAGTGSDASGGGVAFETGSTGGSITQSVIGANTAERAAGIFADAPVALTYASVYANTATAGGTPGAGLETGANGSVSLEATVVADNAGGPGCDGTVSSAGHNLATDATCALDEPTDLPDTPADLDSGATPLPTSATLDAGGDGCVGTTDVHGLSRPRGVACEIGAVEADPVVDRKTAILEFWAGYNPNGATPADDISRRMSKAYASYTIGDGATGDAMIAELDEVYGYPDELDPGLGTIPGPGGPSLGHWPFFAVFPMMVRLDAVERPASYEGSTGSATVHDWVTLYGGLCDFDEEWISGVWTDWGSENHHSIRISNCLLALWALRDEPGFDDPSSPDKRHWTHWAGAAGDWLRENIKAGTTGEIHFHNYGLFTMDTMLAFADFPGDAEVAELGREYLDVWWHLMAHEFDAETVYLGVSGNRMFQPHPLAGDPESDPGASSSLAKSYAYPASNRLLAAMNMYDWHNAPGLWVHAAVAASSDYVPLDISRELAQDDDKEFTATMVRPGRSCHEWTGTVCTDFQQAGEHHGIARQLTVNPDYQMGAITYDPEATHNLAKVEAIWYGVNVTSPREPGDLGNHIRVSGIGEIKSATYADYAGINGAVHDDVMIAARDHKTESEWITPSNTGPNNGQAWWGRSRGIRVFFGLGELRRNMEEVDGWWFSKVEDPDGNDVAYAAVRVGGDDVETLLDANGDVRELRIADDDPLLACRTPAPSCCDDTSDPYDCWAPLVIQMGRPGEYDDFDDFKDAVGNPANFSYEDVGGELTLTYTSPSGDQYQMSRQETQASLPKILRSGIDTVLTPVETDPAKAYDSPFLQMPWQSDVAQLCGPVKATGQECVTIDLS